MNFREWLNLRYVHAKKDCKKQLCSIVNKDADFPVTGTKREMLTYLSTHCERQLGVLAPELCEAYIRYEKEIKADKDFEERTDRIRKCLRVRDRIKEELYLDDLYRRNEKLMEIFEKEGLSAAFIYDRRTLLLCVRGTFDGDFEIDNGKSLKTVRREEGVYFIPETRTNIYPDSTILFPHKEISENGSMKWGISGTFPLISGYCDIEIKDKGGKIVSKGLLYEEG